MISGGYKIIFLNLLNIRSDIWRRSLSRNLQAKLVFQGKHVRLNFQ